MQVFSFFDSFLLAKMFVMSPVFSLVLSTTIDNLFAAATVVGGFL
jgi:hypothetical protein